MENIFTYTVAGHSFSFIVPDSLPSGQWLKPYEPFRSDNGEPVFTLKLEQVPTLAEVAMGELVECFNDEAPYL